MTKYSFKKAIVWGCGLHEHTNSYVYAAFHKAFGHMGFDAYWLNEKSDVSGMDFSNSIFLTEWQHSKGMPKRKDCKYILHNCDPKDYDGLSVLHLQTYTDPCIAGTCVHNQDKGGIYEHPGSPEKINDHGSWFLDTPSRKTLFQPWATDLVPDEINFDDATAPRVKESHWCGTIGGGLYGNINEIEPFKKALADNGIAWCYHGIGATSFAENRELVRKSYMAPAIQGTEQCRVGCITCRIFKNISYGQMGATNCKATSDLFGGAIVYNPDTYQLFYDTQERQRDPRNIVEAMKIVKDKHTYINRISTILSVI